MVIGTIRQLFVFPDYLIRSLTQSYDLLKYLEACIILLAARFNEYRCQNVNQ